MLTRLNADELTGDVFKSIPELLDPRVGQHLVFAVQEVSLMVCKLLVEGVRLPQTGIQSLMDPRHQHRLHKHTRHTMHLNTRVMKLSGALLNRLAVHGCAPVRASNTL